MRPAFTAVAGEDLPIAQCRQPQMHIILGIQIGVGLERHRG